MLDNHRFSSEAGEALGKIAAVGGNDQDGSAVVDALALQALFQRVAFELVIPRIQGIGGNIGCHERTLLQAFCMMRGRSDNLKDGPG